MVRSSLPLLTSDSLHVWDEAAIVMENLHQEYDLFLSPTTAFTAPKIGEDFAK